MTPPRAEVITITARMVGRLRSPTDDSSLGRNAQIRALTARVATMIKAR